MQCQLRHEVVELALDADQPHRFVQVQRRFQQAVGHCLGERVFDADAELADLRAASAARAQRLFQFLAQGEDVVGVAQGHAPVVGEFQLAPGLAEELAAQALFQLFDLPRQSLRREVQLLAGLDHAAGFGGDPEVVQVLEVHASIFPQ